MRIMIKRITDFSIGFFVKILPEIGDSANKMVIPAGFEPTACRLGVAKTVRLGVPLSALECLILLDF